jgi:transcriptional regulator with XRE-family HTH domain
VESQRIGTTAEWEARIGRSIRELRQRANLTQAELAERSNASLSAVRYLESGKGSSLATLVRVVRALERTEWLEALAPPGPSISPIALLRAQQDGARRATRRIRHGRARPRPA